MLANLKILALNMKLFVTKLAKYKQSSILTSVHFHTNKNTNSLDYAKATEKNMM
jgi:hypothetical protein